MNWEQAVRSLIDDPQQQQEVRQCYFDAPLRAAVVRYHQSNEWRSIRKKLPRPPGLALDVGAGNGLVSYALATDGWNVTAVEPDPSALVGAEAIRGLAAESQLNISVVQGLTNDLTTLNDHFDIVVARQVFHHAPDIDAFAVDLARLLKPGGLLLTWRDHVISRPEDLEAFFDRHPLHRKYGGENAFPERAYRLAIEGAGLSVQASWRQFDDPMNFGPQTMGEVLADLFSKSVPRPVGAPAAAVLGSPAVYPLLAPVLSAIDRRPGRLVAFLARKPT